MYSLTIKFTLEVANDNLGQLNLDVHYTIEEHVLNCVLVPLKLNPDGLHILLSLVLVDLQTLTLLFLLLLQPLILFIELLLNLGELLLGLKLGILLHLALLGLSILDDLVRESLALQDVLSGGVHTFD